MTRWSITLNLKDDNETALDLFLDLARRPDASVGLRTLAVEAMGLMAEEVGASMPGVRRVQAAVLAALEAASLAVRRSAIGEADWMGLVAARPRLRSMAQADHSSVRGVGRISVQARGILAALAAASGSADGGSASA